MITRLIADGMVGRIILVGGFYNSSNNDISIDDSMLECLYCLVGSILVT